MQSARRPTSPEHQGDACRIRSLCIIWINPWRVVYYCPSLGSKWLGFTFAASEETGPRAPPGKPDLPSACLPHCPWSGNQRGRRSCRSRGPGTRAEPALGAQRPPGPSRGRGARRGRPSLEPVAQPGCNGGRSKAARVPAEPGTIPSLCAPLLGAQETKGKCQGHVNQARYSATITSLSGLQAPGAQAGHLRGGPRARPRERPAGSLQPRVRGACPGPGALPGPAPDAQASGGAARVTQLWLLNPEVNETHFP